MCNIFPEYKYIIMCYYILKDKKVIEIDNEREWGDWMECSDRTIKKTNIFANVEVSTVFGGKNYNRSTGEALFFETMIFGGEHDGHFEQYATFYEAESGHERAIAMIFTID